MLVHVLNDDHARHPHAQACPSAGPELKEKSEENDWTKDDKKYQCLDCRVAKQETRCFARGLQFACLWPRTT